MISSHVRVRDEKARFELAGPPLMKVNLLRGLRLLVVAVQRLSMSLAKEKRLGGVVLM